VDSGAGRLARPLADSPAAAARPADTKTPGYCEVALSLPKEGSPQLDQQQWLLAESWWARVITPPRFGQLARWAVPMAPWLACEYAVAAGTTQNPCPPEPARKGSFEQLRLHRLLDLVIPPVALVLVAFVLLLDLLQRLPLIGRSATKLVGKFEQGVGDAYLFCLDGPARGAMKQRISRDLAWLLDRCDQVAVVAHSQGAALCHDVLSGVNELRPGRPVDLFVTVGSGVRRLYGMRELYRNQQLQALGWQGVLAALASTVGLLVAGIGLAVGSGSWPAVLAGGVLVLLGAAWQVRVHGKIAGQVTKPLPKLALPATSANAWIDYYATADPVPNGPICTDAKEPGRVDVESCVVHNYRSVSEDHSGYVDNTDQVLTRLALHLADSANTGLALKFTDPTVRDGWRWRRWRTMCRSIARDLLLGSGAAAAILLTLPAAAGAGWWRLGRRLGASGGDPEQPAAALLGLKTWVEKRPLLGLQTLIKTVGPETFVGVAAALIVVVLSAGWLAWRWSRWDAGDIDHLFETAPGRTPSTRPKMPRTAWAFWLMVTAFVVGSALVAATFAPLHGVWLAILWGVVAAVLAGTAWLLRSRWRTYFSIMKEPQLEAIAET
jgi:hypothetical protein